MGCSGVRSVVVAVILVVSVGGIFIGIVVGSVVVGSSRKLSSAMSAVDFVKGCVSWGVRVSPIGVCAVVSEIAVVVIVVGSVVVGSGIRKSSSKSSATSAVRCVSGGV